MTVVYVAIGSALGGVCRYLVSILLNSPSGFPWGTLKAEFLDYMRNAFPKNEVVLTIETEFV